MPLYYARSVVIHILHRLVGHIDERNVIEIPLMVVQVLQIRLMIQYAGATQIRVGQRIWTRVRAEREAYQRKTYELSKHDCLLIQRIEIWKETFAYMSG